MIVPEYLCQANRIGHNLIAIEINWLTLSFCLVIEAISVAIIFSSSLKFLLNWARLVRTGTTQKQSSKRQKSHIDLIRSSAGSICTFAARKLE